MNVRLAYSKTLNRPELRELSPFSMYNYETGYSETGDTNLVTAQIRNYDLRWELYPSPGEFAAVGVFYKDFKDPIQKFVNEHVGGYALKPLNGEEAYLFGWEAELRVSAISVWKALHWMVSMNGELPSPAWLPWSFVANHSRVTSMVTYLDYGIEGKLIPFEKPFTGQSGYATNLGVFYSDRRWDGSLLYKAFGRRVEAYGTGSLPDIYEFPAESLDLALGVRMNNNTRLKLTAENLLDQETVFRQDTEITKKWNTGTRIGFAVSFEPSVR
jgi:outer membrane receptor protein involved in Fe transport